MMFHHIYSIINYTFLLLLTRATIFAQENPIVKVDNGLIKGARSKTVNGHVTYHSFRGIPYAQPPVGELRFRSPLPAKNWNGTLDCTAERNICVQFTNNLTMGSEDCLYVNVYTTNLPKDNSNNELLPVMVWLHGGYFLGGSGNYEEFGPDYLLEQNVVYVSLNYRLGVFGFLSTQDSAAPGNFGLKDQLLALKWVRNNIKQFGGDSNNVTIFGESAGSVSVSYLVQTPKSKGLYRRAILQSGTSLCLWGFSREPRKVAFNIGFLSGIITDDSSRLINQLRRTNYKYLNSIAAGSGLFALATRNPLTGFVFAPTIEPESDDAIVIQKSHHMIDKYDHNLNNVTYFVGLNSLEGKFFSNMLGALKLYLLSYDIVPRRLVPIDMNVNNNEIESVVARKIVNQYFANDLLIARSDESLLKFLSDDQFVRPIVEYVRMLSAVRNCYMYVFTYEGYLGSDDRNTKGVGHAEDLYYIFRTNRDQLNISENDLIVRRKMIRLWTNFAKYGNPTPNADVLLDNVIVPLTSSDNDYSYVNIGQNLSIATDPFEETVEFYNDLYETYGNPPYDTY